MKTVFLAAGMAAVLIGCADTAYRPNVTTMDPMQARAVVERTLNTAANSGNIATGNWRPSAKIFAIRVRGDAFGIAMQDARIDWSLFNDVKYAPPGMRICSFASLDPALTDYGALGSPRYGVQIPECELNIYFPQYGDAKNFVDALYSLKMAARR